MTAIVSQDRHGENPASDRRQPPARDVPDCDVIEWGSIVNKTIRPTQYDSAIDWWIAALMLLAPVLSAALGVQLLVAGNADGAIYLFLIGAGGLLLTMLLTVPCRYTILDDLLSVRCGVIFFRIPLAEIESIEPSGSWLNGPALSLRRVKIRTPNRSVLVSPRQREEFIADLRSAVARIQSDRSD